jgi:hypothetical protein
VPTTKLWTSVAPGPVLTYVETAIEAGSRIDVYTDRVHPGRSLSLQVRTRLGSRVEVEPRIDQVRLTDGGMTVLQERVAQVLGVLHLTARDSLRLIVQRVGVRHRADATAGVAAFDDRGRTLSLTYAHRRAPGRVLYVGLTREQGVGLAVPGHAAREAFVKMEWQWP